MASSNPAASASGASGHPASSRPKNNWNEYLDAKQAVASSAVILASPLNAERAASGFTQAHRGAPAVAIADFASKDAAAPGAVSASPAGQHKRLQLNTSSSAGAGIPPPRPVGLHDQDDSDILADPTLQHPARMISSYLFKQGKARKKWSERYFTLHPTKFQLTYAHKKARDDPASSSTTVQFATMDAEDDDDVDSTVKVVTISLRRFRLESDGTTQFTIILPAGDSDSLDDGRSLHSPSSSGSSASLPLLSPKSPKERRIELRAADAKVAREWMQELRRLQFQSTYLGNYATILSRNKAYSMQGRLDLCQDPNPLGIDIEAMGVSIDATGALTKKKVKKATKLSLLASVLTGADRTPTCSRCSSSFHLLSSQVRCGDCGECFCTRQTCMTPRSYAEEEHMDTFEALSMKDEISRQNSGAEGGGKRKSKKRKPEPPRLCVDCENARKHDAIYQQLLHGRLNLCLRVCSASHIVAANLLARTSDPYVKFKIGSREYRTSVQHGTLNPIWSIPSEAEFNIPWSEGDVVGGGTSGAQQETAWDGGEANSPGGGEAGGQSSSALPRTLCLELYDYEGLSSDTFLGCVYLQVGDLEKNVLYEDEFSLRNKKVEEEMNRDLQSGDDKDGGGGKNSDVLASLEKMLQSKKKVTGTLHLQVILTTAAYTSELLRILPSLQMLHVAGHNGSSQQQAAVDPADKNLGLQQRKNALGMLQRQGTVASLNAVGMLQRQGTVTSLLSSSASVTPAQSSAVSSSAPSTAASAIDSSASEIHQAIASFLASSRLHSILYRSIDLVLALSLSETADTWHAILTYEQPFWSIFVWLAYSVAVVYFPVWGLLALLPGYLLLRLLAALLAQTLATGDAAISLLIRADLAAEKEAERVTKEEKRIRKASTMGGQLKGKLGGFFKSGMKKAKGFLNSPTAESAETPQPSPQPTPVQTPRVMVPSQTGVVAPSPSVSVRGISMPPPPSPALSSSPKDDKAALASSPTDGTAASPLALEAGEEDSPIAVDDAPLDDDERHGNVILRMRRLKRQVRRVQSLLDTCFDVCEEAVKIWMWKDEEKSRRFMRACVVGFFVAYYFSTRTILLCVGAWMFSRHLFKLRRRIRAMRKAKLELHMVQAVRRGSRMHLSKLEEQYGTEV